MEISEIIGLISVIASALVGILGVLLSAISLIGARKDKEYILKHNERLTEQKIVSEIIANYISSVSIAKLGTLLRRSAAKKSVESVSDFMKSTEKLLAEIDAYTVEIVSINEISKSAIREKILLLRHNHIKTINGINDLKAACSMDKLTSTEEREIAHSQYDLSEELSNSQELYNDITEALYDILNQYINRVKW